MINSLGETPPLPPDEEQGSSEFVPPSAKGSGGTRLLIDDEIDRYDPALEFEIKKKRLELLKRKSLLVEELPHKYGFNWYSWQKEYQAARMNKNRLLTAANQIGKSTVQVVEAVEMATNLALWETLWRRKPRLFWYFYPSMDTFEREFNTKWIPDILPRGSMKEHPIYGWKLTKKGGMVSSIHFNSGVTISFLSYTMDITNLQSSTVDAIFCDEECPEDFWDELNFRRKATNGYFSSVFTATLGQDMWYKAMERRGESDEKFPDAWKRQVSLYDCMFFADGTPSHIDEEYIQTAIQFCKNEAEVLKRVYGRFAVDSGLKYPQFHRNRHISESTPVPSDWNLFAGVDIGAGGADNHPSTIVFVAVDPTYTRARVFDCWKGDKQLTTDMDVYERLMTMMAGRHFTIFYDYHAKDFHTICSRRGLSVIKADKRHDVGESVINVLFKASAMTIDKTPESEALIYELTTLKIGTDKRKAVDDLTDALRYAVTRIPFAWEKLGILTKPAVEAPIEPLTQSQIELKERRDRFRNNEEDIWDIDKELNYWGQFYDVE